MTYYVVLGRIKGTSDWYIPAESPNKPITLRAVEAYEKGKYWASCNFSREYIVITVDSSELEL